MVTCSVGELSGVCPIAAPARYSESPLLVGYQVDSLHTSNLRSRVTSTSYCENTTLPFHSKNRTSNFLELIKRFNQWIKSLSMSIQMKSTVQYFSVIIMLHKVVLTFECTDEILKYYHSNETY